MLTLGAGLGLMSISVIVADCVMLHCTKKKKFYQQIKELDANECDDPNVDNAVAIMEENDVTVRL